LSGQRSARIKGPRAKKNNKTIPIR
jgi:hypothetical protein